MKLTLLDLTQNILSSMDSDEVNSISDTTESRQVAEIIKTAYFNIISRANLPEHFVTFGLEASTDDQYPVTMFRPENISRIEWLKYNISDIPTEINYAYVTITPLDQFLDMVNQLDEYETYVDSFELDGRTFKYRTDKAPTYCTIYKDYQLIFDSFDVSIDTTLQESKTLAYGLSIPTFQMEDNFIPDLDDTQFPLLLNEAKSLAFLELKQMNHEAAILESRRQWRTLQRTKDLVKPNYLDQLPNFGRPNARYSRSIFK